MRTSARYIALRKYMVWHAYSCIIEQGKQNKIKNIKVYQSPKK